MAEERIYFGFAGENLVIVPVGHITATLCPELKARTQTALGPDSHTTSLRFDFSDCSYMDSTFLGLIVYFAKAARGLGIGAPVVHRANPQCKSLFRTMGMTKMLEFSDEACPSLVEKVELAAQETMSASFLLDVHKELSLLSPENEERFHPLTNALEETLRRMDTSIVDGESGENL